MTERNNKPIADYELRRRAEDSLGASSETTHPLGKGEESLKLLHELQVHQIELEMQNAELRQARIEVETALEQYTELYDFAPVGYVTLDRNGIIRAVNLTGSGLLGAERSRLIGRRFGRFVTDNSRSAFVDFLGKIFTGPAKVACEVSLLKDGEAPLYVQIEGAAVASGEECRIVLIDISGRKQAAEALRLAKEAAEVLHLANEAAKVLRQANEAAVALRLTNEATEALHLAHEATEALLIAKEAAEVLRLANEATEALRLANEATETLRLENESARALFRAKEAAEVLRLANEASAALRQAKEAAVALRLAKEAAMELRLAKESAEKTARTKSQFFANMSHELRTPMTGILGMLQLALEEDLAPAPREYLETTLRSARSLLRILNDILDMAKLEAGKLIIEEKPFSPHRCLTEAVDFFTPETRRKGLDFVITVAEEVPDIVAGDQARLRQILINLVGNAIKFTEEGKVEVRVTAGRMTSDGKREFTFVVTDTGIGIPADKKDLLFRTFSQVDSSHSRTYGGTGLGLAICRELVELMGGTISLESREGAGSTFSFTIPLRETGLASDALIPAESLLPEIITIAAGDRIPRLLLAEDDPVIRQILELMLKRSNYDLDLAEDGLKAVEMWEKGEYDLMLMDVQMPRLNGFEATRVIRQKELMRGGHTAIVAMTAHAGKEDEERCIDAGMDAFISKPIDFKKCLQIIGQIIKQKSGST